MPTRPNDRHGFEVAILCALPPEADPMTALFDHHWDYDGRPPFDKALGDPNTYSTGMIGRHNVVLVHMPGMGKVNAATVATYCLTSFPNIRLALVAGICGVVPFRPDGAEIVLGDVVISDGIVQYDLGRRLPDKFVIKDEPRDALGKPRLEIQTFLAKLRTFKCQEELISKMTEYLEIIRQTPQLHGVYPGSANDKLFEAAYRHGEDQKPCEEVGCDGKLVSRRRLQTTETSIVPTVHLGLVASGDSVMKSGEDRDRIAEQTSAIAFEMEGAGVWDIIPCIVIKGACDYADSHKNKAWQRYAATTAAACTKALLGHWIPSVSSAQMQTGQAGQTEPNLEHAVVIGLSQRYYSNLPSSFVGKPIIGRRELLDSIAHGFECGCSVQHVGLYGLGGMGKSHVAFEFAYQFEQGQGSVESHTKHTFWLNAGDQSQLDKSSLEICRKIGLSTSSRPLATLKEWMEDISNGPWILVVDGLNELEHASACLSNLPRCALGQTIITTRHRQCLEDFTDLKHETTISVNGLSSQDSRALFDSMIRDSNMNVTDDAFEELLSLVKTPLFVRLSAKYLLRYKVGMPSLRGLIEKLSRTGVVGLNDSKMPRTLATSNDKHELLYKMFSVLLSPFVDSYNPDDETFLFLGIISCFAHISLEFRILAGFYNRQEELSEYLGIYGNHCFVERGADGHYSMHDLVASSFIDYVHKSPRLGPRRVLSYFGWMLCRILDLYIEDKKRQTARNNLIRRDSYPWKVEYMPHFERFLDYVSRLKQENLGWKYLDEWKFPPRAAESVVTFTRPLASDNRTDEAILLLRFVNEQGIASDGENYNNAKTRVTVKLELASMLEVDSLGRKQREYLMEAKSYVESTLQICEEASLMDSHWRATSRLIGILGYLDLFDDADRHMKTLQGFPARQKNLDPKERIKFEIRFDELRASLAFRHGQAHGSKSRVIEAKKRLEALVSGLQNELPDEEELITNVKTKLAAVNIEIPLGEPLNDAENVYHEVLQKARARHVDKPDHPELARAYLNLALVWLRKGQISRAQKVLARLFQSLFRRYGPEDGLTREVAYNLRLSLRLMGDEQAAAEVDAQFVDHTPLKTGGMGKWFDRDDDPDPGTKWPAEWDVPVRVEVLEKYMESTDTMYARVGLSVDPLTWILGRRRPSPHDSRMSPEID